MSTVLTYDDGAAVVAGGTGGIGEAICRRFADAGVPVVLGYHSSAARAAAIVDAINAGGGRAESMHFDLSSSESVGAMLADVRERHGRVGHVIYAAGPAFDFDFIGDIPDAEWCRVIDADVNSAFHLIQGAVRAFRAQEDGGNLLAVITAAVERVPTKDILSAAPKAAIEMLIRGVARESGRFGIRANCVGPGWIDAGLGKKGLEEHMDAATRERMRKKGIPLQRFGSADDVAHSVVFLCSREAAYITGQSLAVDGGLQL